jgi:hypothetical protein
LKQKAWKIRPQTDLSLPVFAGLFGWSRKKTGGAQSAPPSMYLELSVSPILRSATGPAEGRTGAVERPGYSQSQLGHRNNADDCNETDEKRVFDKRGSVFVVSYIFQQL